MTFSALLVDLDVTAFRELADDPAAAWFRSGAPLGAVAVIVDHAERSTVVGGIASIHSGDVLRLSVAEAAALEGAPRPQSGDVFTVNSRVWTLHGTPWRDPEAGERDWLCPATASGS